MPPDPISPAATSEPQNADPGHSADYFGDYRDHWWNPDFVELMAERLKWANRSRILEVGSGMGHWTRVIAPHLSPGAAIACVDHDPKWADPNPAWKQRLTAQGRLVTIHHADAALLPFADSSFDFVTCQTVLIHVPDPQRVLQEMIRVLQPGGLLLCVEPDNFVTSFGETSMSRTDSLDDDVAAVRFALAQQRGRAKRGLGNLSLGGRLPGMFAAIGVGNIRTFLSDKAMPLFPPYQVPEQASEIHDIKQWYESGVDFARDEIRKNYLAGGGSEVEFEAHWEHEIFSRGRFLEAIRNNKYDGAGGTMMYLVSGVKEGS
ncbi:MAG TPA: methyltransferase domain-containing protein [Opitutaceae bacterium]|jgi:SAM-dependent methyltransferase|nr:methyltransferase domain-containing protein [Opitutaceae bacterium]